MQVNDKIERMFEMVKDRMSTESMATYIGLYNSHGAYFDTKAICEFLGVNDRTLKRMYDEDKVPFKIVKNGKGFVAATANVVAYLHSNDQ